MVMMVEELSRKNLAEVVLKRVVAAKVATAVEASGAEPVVMERAMRVAVTVFRGLHWAVAGGVLMMIVEE